MCERGCRECCPRTVQFRALIYRRHDWDHHLSDQCRGSHGRGPTGGADDIRRQGARANFGILQPAIIRYGLCAVSPSGTAADVKAIVTGIFEHPELSLDREAVASLISVFELATLRSRVGAPNFDRFSDEPSC